MLRGLMFASAGLALAVGLYVLADRQMAPRPGPGLIGVPATQPVLAPIDWDDDARASAATQQAVQLGQGLAGGMPMSPGEAPTWRRFYPSGELMYEFSGTKWTPTEENATHVTVEQPSLRFALPRGQLIQLTGERGNMVTQIRELVPIGIRRGTVQGNVVITVDPLTHEQRELYRSQGVQPPEPIVARLGESEFNLETKVVRSTERFDITGPQFDIIGTGLTLAWDEVEGLITRLRVERGEQAKLRGLGQSDEQNQNAAADADRPASAAGEPARKPRPIRIDRYEAKFEQNVEATQINERGEPSGTLRADVLDLDFELTRGDSNADVNNRPDRDRERDAGLRVKWTGPLDLAPVSSATTQPSIAGNGTRRKYQRQFRLIATGDRVEIEDDRGTIVCDRLVYDGGTGAVTLTRRDDQPIVLRSEKGQEISAQRSLTLDQAAGRMHIAGAGYLQQAGQPGEASRVDWQREMTLTFAQPQIKPGSAATPRAVDLENLLTSGGTLGTLDSLTERLERAEFEGAVKLDRGEDQLTAERVDVTLVPGLGGSLSDAISRLQCKAAEGGLVQLDRGGDIIRCRTLDVRFAADANGRYVPAKALARGEVLAQQGTRKLTANEMDAIFSVADAKARPGVAGISGPGAPGGPGGPGSAGGLSGGLGQVAGVGSLIAAQQRQQQRPGAPDRQARPADDTQRKLTVSSMVARGQVRVLDPAQKVDASADEMTASVGPDNEIVDVQLVGKSDWAKARSQLYAIRGPNVLLNLKKQSARVPGPGELEFESDLELTGKSQPDRTRVRVTWAEQMSLSGDENLGVFIGDVKAESKTNFLQAKQLTINFEDFKPEDERALQQAAAKTAKKEATDLVSRLPEMLGGEKTPDPIVEPVQLTFKKRPTVVTADGAVTAISRQFSRQNQLTSRLRITGEKLVMNVIDRKLLVPTAGTLLIEDYRLADAATLMAKREAAGGNDPFFGEFTGSGLSQTFFSWTRRFDYADNDAATFAGGVKMVHRAGADLVPPAELKHVQALQTRLPARLKGRRSALQAETLSVTFAPQEQEDPRGLQAMDRLGQRDLRVFNARGQVFIKDNDRSVTGEQVTYDAANQLVDVRGSTKAEAVIEQVLDRGRFTRHVGPRVTWDRKSNRIQAPGGRILNSGS